MKKTLLFLSDLAILYASLVLMLFLRYSDEFNRQYYLHIYPFFLIFILWVLVFYIANLYEVKALRNNIHFYSSFYRAIAIAALISVFFFYSIPIYGITPRTNLLLFVAIFAGLATLNRFTFNSLVETRFQKPILIVGGNEQSLELALFIKENPQLGYELERVIDLSPESIREINDLIKQKKINIVVLSPEAYHVTEIINAFYKALEQKVSFYNLSSFYERLTGRVPLGAIDQIWFLENLSEGNKNFYELNKRVVDIVLSVILGLAYVILLPFIALSIKLTSKGPIFYSQDRVGRIGKTFRIIKFRTMKKDAEKETGAVWAQDNDPRITRVGKFLRNTRLDELPQLWNILKGEMSFVGPRAERPEFHDELKAVEFYEERYLIKPGLTGWAQINFRYGSSVADAAEKLKYDLYYIKNRSLILDLGIILKTIRIALQQSGK